MSIPSHMTHAKTGLGETALDALSATPHLSSSAAPRHPKGQSCTVSVPGATGRFGLCRSSIGKPIAHRRRSGTVIH